MRNYDLPRIFWTTLAVAAIGGYASLYTPLIRRDKPYSTTQPSISSNLDKRDMTLGLAIGGLAGLVLELGIQKKEKKSEAV